jgi:DNA helicase IV
MTITNNGVPVIIQWRKFVIGSSFYIPTLMPDELKEQIRKEAVRRRMKVKMRFCVEGNTQGIRVWRIN